MEVFASFSLNKYADMSNMTSGLNRHLAENENAQGEYLCFHPFHGS